MPLCLDSTVSLLHLLGDATRMRLLSLLEREELTVAELTHITDLPQPRVSTHLGKLRDAGLLRIRKTGPSTFYALSDEAVRGDARKVWSLLQGELSDAVLEGDRERCRRLIEARAAASRWWPDSVAGEMERHYSPGRTWEAMARGLLGFVQLGDVLDVGCGDGVIASLLAGRARSVTCLDRSERMIDAARRRLSGRRNVRFQVGDMHELPFDGGAFDQVALFNALTYAHAPARVAAEAARVLRPGGSIAVLTLNAHSHQGVASPYGHIQHGFRVGALTRLLQQVGLDVTFCDVVMRERRKPYFEVVTAFAQRPGAARGDGVSNGRN